jgi:putative FmdB family regulatory protein
MPIYEYECPLCGARLERVQPLNTIQHPKHCGHKTKRIISKPFIYRDFRFNFVKDGHEIRTQKQWKNHLKKNNLTDLTPKERKSIKKPRNTTKDDAKKIAKDLTKKIKEKGGVDWVQGKENPKGKDKI